MTTNFLSRTDLELIGHFTVDSGQAMVGDPCYLDEYQPWNDQAEEFVSYKNKAGEYSYLGACHATLTAGHGELGQGSAVVFTTGYGDGMYPVYAVKNNEGRITKIVIDFLGDIEDEDAYDDGDE